MTRKIYKTAQGKTIDLGALLLQNEQVRAVGNMHVNARGDLLDSGNKVIDQKNRQVQRQYKRQTNVTQGNVVTSTVAAKKLKAQLENPVAQTEEVAEDTIDDLEEFDAVETAPTPAQDLPKGGLAAAIARSRAVKQELDKPLNPRGFGAKLRKI